MKEQAKKKLIKDLLVFGITTVITLALLIVGIIGNIEGLRDIAFAEGVGTGIIAIILVPLIMGFEVAGFVIGWKALSQRLRAYNLLGLIIKVCIAVFLGYIIFPVILIKDIIAYCKA